MSSLSLLATSNKNENLFNPNIPVDESIFVDSAGNSLFSNTRFLEEVWLLAATSGSLKILGHLFVISQHRQIFGLPGSSNRIMDCMKPVNYTRSKFSLFELLGTLEKYEPFKSLHISNMRNPFIIEDCPLVMTTILLAAFNVKALKKFGLNKIWFTCPHLGFNYVNGYLGHAKLFQESRDFQRLIIDCGAWMGKLKLVDYYLQLISGIDSQKSNVVYDLPETCKNKSMVHKYAWQFASYRGHLEVLKYLMKHCYLETGLSNGDILLKLMEWATKGGKLDCLEYLWGLLFKLHENSNPISVLSTKNMMLTGKRLSIIVSQKRDTSTMVYRSIEFNHEHILEWLLRHKIYFSAEHAFQLVIFSKFPISMLHILQHHLNNVEQVHTLFNHRNVKRFEPHQILKLFNSILSMRDDTGLEIAKWFYENGYYSHVESILDPLITNAFKWRNFETVLWFQKTLSNFKWSEVIVLRCMESRHPELLQDLEWLLRHGCPPADYYGLFAVFNLSEEYFDWAFNQQFPLTSKVFSCASRMPDSERILNWLIAHNCPQQ